MHERKQEYKANINVVQKQNSNRTNPQCKCYYLSNELNIKEIKFFYLLIPWNRVSFSKPAVHWGTQLRPLRKPRLLKIWSQRHKLSRMTLIHTVPLPFFKNNFNIISYLITDLPKKFSFETFRKRIIPECSHACYKHHSFHPLHWTRINTLPEQMKQ
jgi:hypothetical protein